MIGFEREDDEILRYYEKVQPHDMFKVWGTELLLRVPLDKAEKFMTKDHGWTPETWEKSMLKKDHESVLAEMEDYFQFATEKAITHRGLSASRSIAHYLCWSWLMNDMELFGYLMEDGNYPNYGCPQLLAVAHKHDMLDLLPDNVYDREVFMNMAVGQPCSKLCPGGCGRGNPGFFRPIEMVPPAKKAGLIVPKMRN